MIKNIKSGGIDPRSTWKQSAVVLLTTVTFERAASGHTEHRWTLGRARDPSGLWVTQLTAGRVYCSHTHTVYPCMQTHTL